MKSDIKKYLALKTALLNEKLKLEARLGEVCKALGQDVSVPAASTAAPASATTTTRGKRTLSEATKAKMRAAHQARWAKLKGGTRAAAVVPATASRKKRKMSAAGRANIIAANKVRWAKVNALKSKSAPK